jgi:hypothetical protein
LAKLVFFLEVAKQFHHPGDTYMENNSTKDAPGLKGDDAQDVASEYRTDRLQFGFAEMQKTVE